MHDPAELRSICKPEHASKQLLCSIHLRFDSCFPPATLFVVARRLRPRGTRKMVSSAWTAPRSLSNNSRQRSSMFQLSNCEQPAKMPLSCCCFHRTAPCGLHRTPPASNSRLRTDVPKTFSTPRVRFRAIHDLVRRPSPHHRPRAPAHDPPHPQPTGRCTFCCLFPALLNVR